MTSERLTETALEQHDKVFTKLQPAKVKTVPQANEEPGTVKARPRLLSHSESRKSLFPGSHDSSYHLERQSSRSSTGTLNSRAMLRAAQAARTWKRLSQRKETIIEEPKVRLENTYRLGPNEDQVFKPDKVQHSMKEVLGLFLRNFKYSHEESKRMCLSISSEIKSRVKKAVFPRYKIVSHVVIAQNRGEGLGISSRCLWTPETDSFATCTLKTSQIICVANVYAVYSE